MQNAFEEKMIMPTKIAVSIAIALMVGMPIAFKIAEYYDADKEISLSRYRSIAKLASESCSGTDYLHKVSSDGPILNKNYKKIVDALEEQASNWHRTKLSADKYTC